MSAELVPLSTHPAALPAIGTPDVVNTWLRARNPNTLRGYLSDLNTFREWLGATSTAAAVEALLSAGQGSANLMTMNYAAALIERGLAGATIARRLAALRSMCKVSRKIGRTNLESRRRGTPGRGAPRHERLELARRPVALARRDWSRHRFPGPCRHKNACMLIRSRVATRRAMQPRSGGRRGRTGGNPACGVGAPRGDLDSGERPDRERAHDPARSNGRRPGRVDRGPRQRIRPALPSPRRSQAGPGRSTLRGIGPPDRARVGQGRGVAPGRSPHGLRHSAATSALDAGRDLRDVRRFTRHRSLEMVLRYDDMRRDVAGEIARDLAGRRDQGREV